MNSPLSDRSCPGLSGGWRWWGPATRPLPRKAGRRRLHQRAAERGVASSAAASARSHPPNQGVVEEEPSYLRSQAAPPREKLAEPSFPGPPPGQKWCAGDLGHDGFHQAVGGNELGPLGVRGGQERLARGV